MKLLHVFLAHLCRKPRRRPIVRSLLAAPFALSFTLALVLGPATVNSVHGSFTWLAALSVAGTLLMFGAAERLLMPIGLAMFLVFPPMVGLGLNFSPAWARLLVAAAFYGSMLASCAAMLAGIGRFLGPALRRRRQALVSGAACLGVLVVAVAAMRLLSAPTRAAASTPGRGTMLTNVGHVINTGQREAEPSFTADGRTMVYNCRNADICISHLTGSWEGGNWSTPQLVGPPISTAYTEVEPWINGSADKLYFNSTRPFARGDSLPGLALYVDGVGLMSRVGVSLFGGLGEDDIWVSYLIDGAWSEPRNINDVAGEPHINTAYFDHCLSFSADGNEAFWTSTRPGGFGGNDIWTARRVDGKWGEAENLGSHVNGPGSEHHSIPTPDGRSLYVTSNRPGGFGGEDIYVAMRGADGKWAPLVNMGPSINGPGSDRCPAWTPDRRIFLLDSDRAGGLGSKDLWWVYFKDVPG